MRPMRLPLPCVLAWLAAVPLMGASSLAAAATAKFDAWTAACDNVRHCEAVAYGSAVVQAGGREAMALWIARDAGPGAAIAMAMTVQLSGGKRNPGRLTLQAGEISANVDPASGVIAPGDVFRLMPALLEAEVAHASGDDSEFLVSTKGLKAALLKIDEVQGRTGTAGAVVGKGNRPESAAPSAPKVPVVTLAVLPAERKTDAALFEQLLADFARNRPVSRQPCWPRKGDVDPWSAADSVTRLSADALLFLHQAPGTTYNGQWCAWIIRDHAPWQPRPVPFGHQAGEPEADLAGEVRFEARETKSGRVGLLSAGRKLSESGDCSTHVRWGWTGRDFVMLAFTGDAQCGGIAGGVPLRQWITQTVPPL